MKPRRSIQPRQPALPKFLFALIIDPVSVLLFGVSQNSTVPFHYMHSCKATEVLCSRGHSKEILFFQASGFCSFHQGELETIQFCPDPYACHVHFLCASCQNQMTSPNSSLRTASSKRSREREKMYRSPWTLSQTKRSQGEKTHRPCTSRLSFQVRTTRPVKGTCSLLHHIGLRFFLTHVGVS